ncbi:acetolactate synthase large subunit [Anopheles sinensis]|uniref:Acetolactate synthase large subunit n=1 Tax=Anopheles sinensis TaxID=74873 RepID=A0A084VRR3_ANOSI|nr:acetolactate synthase large subunit [Anopheles sinensis]
MISRNSQENEVQAAPTTTTIFVVGMSPLPSPHQLFRILTAGSRFATTAAYRQVMHCELTWIVRLEFEKRFTFETDSMVSRVRIEW